MSDAESEEDTSFIFYKDREEWKNVTPIPQDDGPDPVVKINYSKKFTDVYDYFRAVFVKGEKSERVLELTADALALNAANYTVWQYRRDVLQALGIPTIITADGISDEFDKEFQFSVEMIEENQKNYQVWHHRKSLVSWLIGYNEEERTIDVKDQECLDQVNRQELELTERLLARDNKNYHAWQHRQWVISVFKIFKDEMNFVNFLIEEDVRNNSAWNQRYYIVKSNPNCKITPEVIKEEIEYTWSQIIRAPSNESPWNYLRGMYDLNQVILIEDDQILTRCKDLVKSGSKSIHLLSFLLRIYEEKLQAKKGGPIEYKEALQICDNLDKVDKVRSAYWKYLKDRFISKFGSEMSVEEGHLDIASGGGDDSSIGTGGGAGGGAGAAAACGGSGS